jgi:beta-galactosidase
LVNLPHDFIIHKDPSPDAVSGPATGYYDGGLGNYSKTLELPRKWMGKKVIAEFDGVYNIATVGLNGIKSLCNPMGNSVHRGSDTLLRFGVINRCMSRRKYSNAQFAVVQRVTVYIGSGIVISPLIHIATWAFSHIQKDRERAGIVACEVMS